MRLDAKSGAWVGVGAALVGAGLFVITLAWPVYVMALLLGSGVGALGLGLYYAYRPQTRESPASDAAFIVGRTENSTFTDNTTDAPVFQRGDSVSSRYRRNKAGKQGRG